MTDTPNTSPAVPSGHFPAGESEPLPRLSFIDAGPIEGEPATDVRIELADGRALRERLVEVIGDSASTVSADAAPTSRSIVISNALLDDAGAVVRDAEGRPVLTSRHEIVLTNEALGRLGSTEAVAAAVQDAREIAAAKADIEFRGRTLLDEVFGARFRPAQSGE